MTNFLFKIFKNFPSFDYEGFCSKSKNYSLSTFFYMTRHTKGRGLQERHNA